MATRKVQVTFADLESLESAYAAGLQHGLVNAQIRPPPDTDETCEVEFDLPFAARQFTVPGVVVQSNPVATSIMLRFVPAEMAPARLKAAIPEELPARTRPLRRASAEPAAAPTPASRTGSFDPETTAPTPRAPTRAVRGTGRKKRRARHKRPVDRPLSADTRGIPLVRDPHAVVPAKLRLQGDLADGSPYRMFIEVAARRLTGVGVLSLPGAHYWAAFCGGDVAGYRRDPPMRAQAIESLLERDAHVRGGSLDEVRLLVDLTGDAADAVAASMGLIGDAAVANLRRTQTVAVTERILDATEGVYRVFELPRIGNALRNRTVELLPLLMRCAGRAYNAWDDERCRDKLVSMRTRKAVLTALGHQVQDRLPLPPGQDELARRLGAGTAVRELAAVDGLDRTALARTLMSLRKMGIVSLPELGEDDEDEQSLDRQLGKRITHVDDDVFTFSDLHWTALPDELLERADRIEKQVRAYDQHGGTVRDYHRARDRLRQRVGEVRRLARSDAERKRYRADLVGEDKLRMTAEQLIEKADMALYREAADEAADACRRVLEIDTGTAEMRSIAKRARAMLAHLGR